MSTPGRNRISVVAIALWSLCVSAVYADESNPLFDIVTLHAEASGTVANDLLKVEMVVQGENRDSASLANAINASMQWALSELKKFPDVSSSTRQYNTWAKYDRKDNRIIGWNASQVLKLESDNIDQAQQAVQRLQEKLQVRNMQMQPKAATRESREDDLISDALGRFRDRALTVQNTMGAADYRVVNISINTNQQMMHEPQMRSMAESSVASAPAIQPGSSEVVVRVNGTIQLQ